MGGAREGRSVSLWESVVSFGSVVMAALWALALMLIGIGWWIESPALGQFGIWFVAVASVLTVIRDNQRTRRMLARPGEHVGPLGSTTRLRRD